jgi:hypothetical protein
MRDSCSADESPHVQLNARGAGRAGATLRALKRPRKQRDRRRDGSPSPTPPARPRGAVVVRQPSRQGQHMARPDRLFEACPPVRRDALR